MRVPSFLVQNFGIGFGSDQSIDYTDALGRLADGVSGLHIGMLEEGYRGGVFVKAQNVRNNHFKACNDELERFPQRQALELHRPPDARPSRRQVVGRSPG